MKLELNQTYFEFILKCEKINVHCEKYKCSLVVVKLDTSQHCMT